MSRVVTLTVDGRTVDVPEGTTLLGAAAEAGTDIPTLCYLETLTPVNVCRICVVEVEGSRVLVPACSRQAEEGMVVATSSERVRTARRMVLELLGASVDLSLAPEATAWMAEYGADPRRWAASPRPAPKVDNDLYVRDYGRCILCYKCVEACGVDAQWTFAIAVAGRGHEAHISTEYDVELPDSACVFCGNCIAVCPTGALQAKTEWDLRAAGRWDPDAQTMTTTICSYCGVGCNLELWVQEERVVKVTSPLDHDITRGNLCIKGRFGYTYLHDLPDDHRTPIDEYLRRF